MRLPVEGDRPRAANPIKLVAERPREIPVVANYQVKKSA